MDAQANIVVLTGAGISAESGLQTFRAADGLWEGHRVEDVATPEAFARNPALVHEFYDARRARLGEVEPNAAHVALARLDAEWRGKLLIVTQNVDDLHERAGAKRLLHMHGELLRAWCLRCDKRFGWAGAMGEGAACPSCDTAGLLRPDIVWFGEMLPAGAWERAARVIGGADLLLVIGTSGVVLAPLPAYAHDAEARVLFVRAVWVLPFGLSRQGPAPSFIGDNTDRFSFETLEQTLRQIWAEVSSPRDQTSTSFSRRLSWARMPSHFSSKLYSAESNGSAGHSAALS